jgi:hypothetical protein
MGNIRPSTYEPVSVHRSKGIKTEMAFYILPGKHRTQCTYLVGTSLPMNDNFMKRMK